MKKRILSLLLAAMMVVSIFAMPTSVSATDSNSYSYQFEEKDVRNAVEGQVVDLAAKGEPETAPVVDGVVETGGVYKGSLKFPVNSVQGGNTPLAKLPVYVTVKDGYLYVAFTYDGEVAQQNIQYDIGIVNGHRSDLAWARKQATWKKDNTTGDHTWLIKSPGTSDWWSGAFGTKALDTDDFLVEKSWNNGTYEAKFDLNRYYRFFSTTVIGKGIYETPCVSIAIWYAADNTVENHDDDDTTPNALKYPDYVGQTHYAFKVSSFKVDSTVTTDWVPATVIIPDDSLAYINREKGYIGELGTDYSNAVEGQLLNNGRVYSDVLPKLDGVVNAGEYSASQVYTGNTYTTDGNMTMSYSVGEDGLIYVALEYKESTHSPMLVQSGLSINQAQLHASRAGFKLNTNGSISNQNVLFKKFTANAWASAADLWGGSSHYTRQDAAAATKHVDGVTTYEFTMSIPMMIASLEKVGWSADTASGAWFYFFQGSKSVQYKMPGYAASIETAMQPKTGTTYTTGYFSPSIALPKDIVDRFRLTSYEDVEEFFTSGNADDTLDVLNAAPSDVILDGKIGAGEYTAVQTWDNTDARAADSQFFTGISYDISGKNFVAYDEEYLYFAAEVYDPNYVSGKSQFQLNLNVIDRTKPIDIGMYATTRMNFMATMSDAGVTTGNYGGVLRSQTCNASVFYEDDPNTEADESKNKYVGQDEWLAGFNTKKPEAAGNYDAKTKTLTYEFRIKLADLEAAFGVENIDKIHFMTLAVYVDKDTGATTQYAWNFFKDTTAGAMNLIRNWTCEANGGVLNYSNNMFGHMINLNREFATRESASVRISNTVSGLRFKTHYTDTYLAEMAAYAESKGVEMEIGTLIAPKDYITGEFTHAALGEGRYVEVKADAAKPFASANGVTTFAGSLVNIKEANLDRDFAGIGFIKIGSEYFYSDVYSVKNVSSIASAALTDVQATSGNGYVHPVAGGFSPYSEGQRTILSSLIAK